jgi:hypothetical protein
VVIATGATPISNRRRVLPYGHGETALHCLPRRLTSNKVFQNRTASLMEALYEGSQTWGEGPLFGRLSRTTFLAACWRAARDVLRRKPFSRMHDLPCRSGVSARVTVCADCITNFRGLGNCPFLDQDLRGSPECAYHAGLVKKVNGRPAARQGFCYRLRQARTYVCCCKNQRCY